MHPISLKHKCEGLGSKIMSLCNDVESDVYDLSFVEAIMEAAESMGRLTAKVEKLSTEPTEENTK